MCVTGEPDAVKAARPVRRGADGKVLRATGVTRRRPTLPLTQKVREAGRIVNVSVVVATAVNGEGKREIIGTHSREVQNSGLPRHLTLASRTFVRKGV